MISAAIAMLLCATWMSVCVFDASADAQRKQLLKIVADENESPYKRKFHAAWLRKLMPHFKLEFPEEGDSPEEQARKMLANRKLIEGFRTFWEQNRDTEEIKRFFDNPEASPKPQMEEQDERPTLR